MRLFFALPPPQRIQEQLEQQAERLRAGCVRGRVIPRTNIHLTLSFLGEVEDPRPAERAAVRAAGPAFLLQTGRPGKFRGRKGDLWWAGVEDNPPLFALYRRLSRALAEEGVWMDKTKPFHPHLSLGRDMVLHPGFPVGDWADDFPRLRWQAERIVLMESLQMDGVLRYIPRWSCTLQP